MKFLSNIKIYDKYIFKQVVASTFGAVFLFTVIWIAPEMLLNVIRAVMAGAYSVKTGLLVIAYELPNILGKGLPVGLLLGSLFTFDKLSKDSELTIFRAVGMSFFRILAPLLVLSLIVTGLCFITYDKWIPYSCQKLAKIDGGDTITQFIYTKQDTKENPEQAVIVSKYFNGHMSNIIVLNSSRHVYDDLHGMSNILVAAHGRVSKTKEGTPCWRLTDVYSYNIDENGIFHKVKKIKHKNILKGDDATDAYSLMLNSTKRDREFTNKQLKQYVKLLKRENIDDDYRLMLNKYLQRFFHPFVCVLLAILGCLLGFSKPREQRLVGFTIAIACIFLYYITLPFFDLLAEKGVLPPLITASFPIVAFFMAIVAFYKTKDL